jgi:peptidoglycan hydrolase-like protein with peptidoglycan-binding domain
MSDTISTTINTASTSAAKNLPTLVSGNSGEAVRLLQQLLLAAGYFVDFNARFDSFTLQAVRDFQASEGLVVDGIVGPQTWRALGACAYRCSQCK